MKIEIFMLKKGKILCFPGTHSDLHETVFIVCILDVPRWCNLNVDKFRYGKQREGSSTLNPLFLRRRFGTSPLPGKSGGRGG